MTGQERLKECGVGFRVGWENTGGISLLSRNTLSFLKRRKEQSRALQEHNYNYGPSCSFTVWRWVLLQSYCRAELSIQSPVKTIAVAKGALFPLCVIQALTARVTEFPLGWAEFQPIGMVQELAENPLATSAPSLVLWQQNVPVKALQCCNGFCLPYR